MGGGQGVSETGKGNCTQKVQASVKNRNKQDAHSACAVHLSSHTKRARERESGGRETEREYRQRQTDTHTHTAAHEKANANAIFLALLA